MFNYIYGLKKRLWGRGCIVWGLLLTLPLSVAAQVSIPDPPEGKGERCVEDTQFMRRNHMELLLKKRNETMRKGIRTPTHSLKECIKCHAQQLPDGSYRPVTDEGQFCRECHNYAGVHPDCFDCHATTPDSPAHNQ